MDFDDLVARFFAEAIHESLRRAGSFRQVLAVDHEDVVGTTGCHADRVDDFRPIRFGQRQAREKRRTAAPR